jgi:hypothetical protein
MKLEDILKNITQLVENDNNLSNEIKDDMQELVTEVLMSPTPANLNALALVLEKLRDANKYLSSIRTLKDFEANAVTTNTTQ